MSHKLQKFINITKGILSSPTILFWTLPYLVALLVVGTLAQGHVGLHESLNKYFQSFFFLAGFVPLPGGLTICVILFLNLLVKFIYESEWRWVKAGINISHIGVLVLLIGGFIGFVFSEEGALVIRKGEFQNTANAYVDTDFTILKNGQILFSIPLLGLEGDQDFSSVLPFGINILDICRFCDIVARPEPESEGWQGPAKGMKLVEGRKEKRAEENIQGISFEITEAGESDGKYASFTFLPKPPTIIVGGDTFTFLIERTRLVLPFFVRLDEFFTDFYPGSERAKNYTSAVTFQESEYETQALITMNNPARINGFTLYQSSFFELPDGEIASVLSVVKNKGRLFPYISLILVGLGLLLHLAISMMKRAK